MLITSPEFTSNLTGKNYYTKSFDPLDCSTENVIYDIECTLCGLLYVGETRQTLRSRMNKYRYDAKDPQYRILYNHCNQRIKELGIAMPYGCNDNIKGVGNLSSPRCSEINVMSLYNTNPKAKRSHGHKRIQHPNVKKSSKPRPLQDTFNYLLSNIQKPVNSSHSYILIFTTCKLPQRS